MSKAVSMISKNMESIDEVKIARIMVMVTIDSFAVVSASSKFCSRLVGWSPLYNSKACTTGCMDFDDKIVGGGTSGRSLTSTSPLDYSPLLLGSGIIPNGNLHVENALNFGKSTYIMPGRAQLASRVQSLNKCTWAFDRSRCNKSLQASHSC